MDIEFEDLDGPAQVAACLAELDALTARLDAILDGQRRIRVEVRNHDGTIRMVFGSDCRLLSVFIADSVPRNMSNLELEAQINDLIAAGNEEVAADRAENMGSYAVSP